MDWQQWLVGGGLLTLGVVVTRLWPILKDWLDMGDARQGRFLKSLQDRLDAQAHQLDAANVSLLVATARASAAEARYEFLRDHIKDTVESTNQTGQDTHRLVNSQKEAMEAQIADLLAQLAAQTEKINRLEEAQAAALKPHVGS